MKTPALAATISLAAFAFPLAPPRTELLLRAERLAGVRESFTPYRPQVLEEGRSWVMPGLPMPPSDAEVAVWAWLIAPDDPGRTWAAIADPAAQYRGDELRQRLIEATPLMNRAVALGSTAAATEVDSGDGHRSFFDGCRRFIARCAARDESFIRSLAEQLEDAPGLAARLDLVVDFASIRRSFYYPEALPASDADLVACVALEDLSEPLVRRDPEAFDGALRRLLSEQAALRTRWLDVLYRVLGQSTTHLRAAEEAGKDVGAALASLRSEWISAEEAIVRHVRDGADELARHLDAAGAQRLRDRVGATQFPEIYPSAWDLSPLVVAVEAAIAARAGRAESDFESERADLDLLAAIADAAARQREEFRRMESIVLRVQVDAARDGLRATADDKVLLARLEPSRGVIRRNAEEVLDLVESSAKGARAIEPVGAFVEAMRSAQSSESK